MNRDSPPVSPTMNAPQLRLELARSRRPGKGIPQGGLSVRNGTGGFFFPAALLRGGAALVPLTACGPRRERQPVWAHVP